jgi:hypothetical protein
MSSLVTTPPLGSKENPHPITPSTNEERTIGHYYIYNGEIRQQRKSKGRKNGRLAKSSEQNKRYNNTQKPKIKEDRKQNPEKYKEYGRRQQKRLHELGIVKPRNFISKEISAKKRKERMKNYRANPKNKKRKCELVKERYKNDIQFRINAIQRSRLHACLKGKNVEKNMRTKEYFGCSPSFIKEYIEILFTSGMTWENQGFGKGKWNIDHRRCCSSFDWDNYTDEDIYKCWHWTNLQPMWHVENCHEKGGKFDPKTFRYKWIDRETGWVGIPKYLMNK